MLVSTLLAKVESMTAALACTAVIDVLRLSLRVLSAWGIVSESEAMEVDRACCVEVCVVARDATEDDRYEVDEAIPADRAEAEECTDSNALEKSPTTVDARAAVAVEAA